LFEYLRYICEKNIMTNSFPEANNTPMPPFFSITTCKYCGSSITFKYSAYYKKMKPMELHTLTPQYHTCKNGGAKVTVIKMSPEEMNKEYGGPVSRRKYEAVEKERRKILVY
jgi:hypothetical protein